MVDKLAIDGGSQTVPHFLLPYNHIGDEEIAAVVEVLKSGVLSGFVGSWGPAFTVAPKYRISKKHGKVISE